MKTCGINQSSGAARFRPLFLTSEGDRVVAAKPSVGWEPSLLNGRALNFLVSDKSRGSRSAAEYTTILTLKLHCFSSVHAESIASTTHCMSLPKTPAPNKVRKTWLLPFEEEAATAAEDPLALGFSDETWRWLLSRPASRVLVYALVRIRRATGAWQSKTL